MNENNNSENNVENENSNSENNANTENSNSENNAANTENSNSNNTDNENSNSGNNTVPLSTFMKQKDELKETRDALKKLEDKLQTQQDKEKKEQGKFEELYNEKAAEVETLKVKAEKYDMIHENVVKEAKEAFGEQWSDDMSKLETDTLRKLTLSKTKKDPSVDMDQSKNMNDGEKKIKLTDAQKERAYEMFPQRPKEEAEKAYASIQHKVEIKKKE